MVFFFTLVILLEKLRGPSISPDVYGTKIVLAAQFLLLPGLPQAATKHSSSCYPFLASPHSGLQPGLQSKVKPEQILLRLFRQGLNL